jgi:hypothetical protein
MAARLVWPLRVVGAVALAAAMLLAPGAAGADPVPVADLSVTLTAPADIPAGTSMSYTMKAHNAGPDASDGYTATLELPVGVSFESASPEADCNEASEVVTCGAGSLAAEGDATYVIDVHVAPGTRGNLVADATVAATGLAVNAPGNDTAQATTTAFEQADLEPSIAASSPQVAGASGGFDYTVGVTNHGPSDNAGGFTVDVRLPDGVTYVDDSSDARCAPGLGGDATCTNDGGLGVGNSDSFTVHVTTSPSLANDTAPTAHSLVVHAVVTTGGTDPTPENDDRSSTVSVESHANLSVTLSRTPALIFANGPSAASKVTFTAVITNNGPSDAPAATLASVLDSRLGDRKACVTPGASCTPTTGGYAASLDLGTLGPTATRTVVIEAQMGPTPPPQGTFSTQVTAGSSATADDVSANNDASVSTAYHTVPAPPTAVTAYPGNTNVVVSWTPSADNGGESIDAYRVTVLAGPSQTFVKTVDVPSGPTPANKVSITSLANGTQYTFKIEAHNAVGYSAFSALSNAVTPTVNNSAVIIGGSVLVQQTGNGVATTADPQVALLNFASGTKGIGTLEETSVGANTFCNGKCLGNPVINKLQDPTLSSRYLITMLYDKSIARGTGVSFTAYLSTSTSPTAVGTPLNKCPKTIVASTPPCVAKLTRDGQNSDLKAVISVPGTAAYTDPKNGLR